MADEQNKKTDSTCGNPCMLAYRTQNDASFPMTLPIKALFDNAFHQLDLPRPLATAGTATVVGCYMSVFHRG